MPSDIFGLPSHILLLHAALILVPLAAIATLFIVVWPRARERYGVAVVAFAFLSTVTVPLTAQAGENLLARMPSNPLIRAHASVGRQAVPWAAVFGILLAVVVAMDIYRRSREGRLSRSESWIAKRAGLDGGGELGRLYRPAFRAFQVLSVAASIGVIVVMVLAGQTGAKAVWAHYPNLSSTPIGGGG